MATDRSGTGRQEACVFVLGESGAEGSKRMLTDIFISSEDKIACYCAVFLSDLNISEFSDDEKTKIISRLNELYQGEKFKKFGDHYQISLEKIFEKIQAE